MFSWLSLIYDKCMFLGCFHMKKYVAIMSCVHEVVSMVYVLFWEYVVYMYVCWVEREKIISLLLYFCIFPLLMYFWPFTRQRCITSEELDMQYNKRTEGEWAAFYTKKYLENLWLRIPQWSSGLVSIPTLTLVHVSALKSAELASC